MKTPLSVIFVFGLVLTLAELAYIYSSPIIGGGDHDLLIGPVSLTSINASDTWSVPIYQSLWETRPHKNDPKTGMYKIYSSGWVILDEMSLGIIQWRLGIINSCEPESNITKTTHETLVNWERHRPAAIGSGLAPVRGPQEYDTSSESLRARGGFANKMGKQFPLLDMGWLMLDDLIGSNSVALFEDRCAKSKNITREQFLKEYSNLFGVHMARSAFGESILDEEPHWRGILYAAYYPAYDKTLLVMYGLSKEDLDGANVSVNGAARTIGISHPFVFVDGSLSPGENRITLATKTYEYPVVLDYEKEPINMEWIMLDVSPDGKISAGLSTFNDAVFLKSVKATVDGKEASEDFNTEMPPYNATHVRLDLNKTLSLGKGKTVVDFNITYRYSGAEKTLLRRAYT